MNVYVYTKDGCPWCVKVKELLDGWDVHYEEVDLTDDALRKQFYEEEGVNTVPQVFVSDYGNSQWDPSIRVGGYSEIERNPALILGPQLLREKKTYVLDYKVPVEMAKKQNEVFWLADEIEVEKDVQDIMTNLTESERHGVITVLKLFTLYELMAGDEYWGERVKNTFPRPDIRMMASSFSYFELNVHAPFYNKLNEALHLNTEEFYSDYVNDPTLKARMEFIDNIVNDPDELKSLAVFSMVEGAVLYSSFAFLKHFQSKGKNKLLNVVRGINFSVRDENLHCLGGAWLYKTLKEEMRNCGRLVDDEQRTKEIYAAAEQIFEHESRVVDMIFEKGNIEGITKTQMKNFIQSRINECLINLGLDPIYKVTYNPIAEWFYDSINSYAFHDFFTGIGAQYNRNWNESKFEW
jgi:ribonucleotide reductase beta subunit family protein with ferritin-like domain/glutaredoxin